jgi:membrane protein
VDQVTIPAIQTKPDTATPVEVAGSQNAGVPAAQPKWYRWRKDGTDLAKYLMDSEVQTYAFSVAANVVLSFIPLIYLLTSISHGVFHQKPGEGMDLAIKDMFHYFVPTEHYQIIVDPNAKADFSSAAAAMLMRMAPRHSVKVFSLFMILVGFTGIFVPLEVALNQAWGVKKGRGMVMNQVVALGLALGIVVLGLVSMAINAGAREALAFVFFHNVDNFVYRLISFLFLVATTGAASILFFFAIYWLLPNKEIPWKPVFRVAAVTGAIWIVAKYIFLLAMPLLDLETMYGPFQTSVGLLFWAYVSGLILFAGAQFSVTRLGAKVKE